MVPDWSRELVTSWSPVEHVQLSYWARPYRKKFSAPKRKYSNALYTIRVNFNTSWLQDSVQVTSTHRQEVIMTLFCLTLRIKCTGPDHLVGRSSYGIGQTCCQWYIRVHSMMMVVSLQTGVRLFLFPYTKKGLNTFHPITDLSPSPQWPAKYWSTLCTATSCNILINLISWQTNNMESGNRDQPPLSWLPPSRGIISTFQSGRDHVDVILLDFAKAFDKEPKTLV